MAGNSQRRGAVRRSGKTNPAGSGGRRRKGLEGRGPTPPAEQREYHPAHRRAQVAQEAAERAKREEDRARVAHRSGGDAEVVAGRNAVLEALRAGAPIRQVWLAHGIDADERIKQIVFEAGQRSIQVVGAGKSELDRLSDHAVHQGVVAELPAYDYCDVEDLLDAAAAGQHAPFLVALDGVTDPRNLGAVLRSGGAFGIDGVIVPSRRSAGVTASVWKVSAGAVARVPVAKVTNLVRALNDLKTAGCFVVGLDGGGDMPIGELPYATDPIVLVVGSEGKGLSRLVRETCDAIAAIPITAEVESLNAGVAVGIALYEVARQRAAEDA